MNEIKEFSGIESYLTHPLVLVGFVLLLVFSVHRILIKSGIIPPLPPGQGGRLISSLLRYGFIIALLVILLGFALEFFKTYLGKPIKEPNIISPHISTLEALDRVRSSYIDDLKNYELVEVVGSFYSFLKKPDLVFHQFPEWVFVFRNTNTQELLKFKVADSRVPKIPPIGGEPWRKLEPDWIVYYVRKKHSTTDTKFKLKAFDSQGKLRIEWEGEGQDDPISEVLEATDSIVLARYQIHGKEVEGVSKFIVMEDVKQMGNIEIRMSKLPPDPFHSKLRPLRSSFIDAMEAIELAKKKGAQATQPDKEGRGGSGVFRLFDGPRESEHIDLLNGPYWDIPYRVGIMNPILVHAYNEDVYSLNKKLEYTSNQAEWITSDELEKLQKSHTQSRETGAPEEQVVEEITPAEDETVGKEAAPVKEETVKKKTETIEESPEYEANSTAERQKEITELTSEELEVANGICQKALEAYFGDRIIAWYSTTYNYLPTSDDDIVPDFSKMKKLTKPITVVSVIGVAFSYRFDEIKRELKTEVDRLEASYHGKKYHVVKSLVLVELGGGGGYDKVTIIPYTVAIY